MNNDQLTYTPALPAAQVDALCDLDTLLMDYHRLASTHMRTTSEYARHLTKLVRVLRDQLERGQQPRALLLAIAALCVVWAAGPPDEQ